jgi:hypothetical protein
LKNVSLWNLTLFNTTEIVLVLEEHTASIFSEQAKQQAMDTAPCKFLGILFNPEDGDRNDSERPLDCYMRLHNIERSKLRYASVASQVSPEQMSQHLKEAETCDIC